MLLILEKRICPLSLQNPFPVSGKTELYLLDYPQSIFVGLFSLYICWIILNIYLLDYPQSIFVGLSLLYIWWHFQLHWSTNFLNWLTSLYSTAVQWNENYRKLKGDFVLRTRSPARICKNLWLHLEKMLAILFVQKNLADWSDICIRSCAPQILVCSCLDCRRESANINTICPNWFSLFRPPPSLHKRDCQFWIKRHNKVVISKEYNLGVLMKTFLLQLTVWSLKVMVLPLEKRQKYTFSDKLMSAWYDTK